MNERFSEWAILELMGQRRLGGLVSEQEIAQTAFLRVDVPGVEGEGATRFYPASVVFCITPTTEERARAVALTEMPKTVPIDRIKEVVAEYFDVPLEELSSERRERRIAGPRQVAMYLARELSGSSLPTIGRAFGARHHTTALRAIAKISKQLTRDAGLRQAVEALRDWLRADRPPVYRPRLAPVRASRVHWRR
jgi:chromosomal replication initiation ATPase DnaA